jgi:hypothetical protein
MKWEEMLSFRVMITPKIIQILYYIGLVLVALGALGSLAMSLTVGVMSFLVTLVIVTPLTLIFGFLAVRVYCELLILLFKIYEELKAIRTGAPPEEVTPVAFPMPGPGTPSAPTPGPAPTPSTPQP